jgi:hypothetical protein
MGWFYSWATREYCLYRLTFSQLVVYWRQGSINQKMHALRIAGHMNGVDVDAEMSKKSEEELIATHETSYDTIGMFFGVDLS